MATPFENEYILRTVAETASKPCLICYKPSTKVLITSNNKDFFYICPGHLEDRGFASAKVDPRAEAEKREKEELRQEIELIKKEYEEKQKRKDKKTDDEKKEDGGTDLEKEKDDKIKALESKAAPKTDDSPRVYNLHRDIFQMRLKRLRDIETAKRAQARMKDPNLFPSVPTRELP